MVRRKGMLLGFQNSLLSELRGNAPREDLPFVSVCCVKHSQMSSLEKSREWSKWSSEMVSGLTGNDRAVIKKSGFFFFVALFFESHFLSHHAVQAPYNSLHGKPQAPLKAVGCELWVWLLGSKSSVVKCLLIAKFWEKAIMPDHFSDTNGKWFIIICYWATKFSYRVFLSRSRLLFICDYSHGE